MLETTQPAAPSREHSSVRLGELLVERGTLREADLAAALVQHHQVGVPLGSVLLARGLISRQGLYAALGDLWGLPVTDLAEVEPDLVRMFTAEEMNRDGWVPVRAIRAPGGHIEEVVVAANGRLEPHVEARVLAVLGASRVTPVVATDWDIRRVVREVCVDELIDLAVEGLARTQPEASARRVTTRPQRVVGILVLLVVAGCAIMWSAVTTTSVLLAINAVFILSVGFKVFVSAIGATREGAETLDAQDIAALGPADLPTYTILVPAFREANVIGSLMANLANLDYPREKLEILLLLEADDPETIAAAKAAAPPDVVKIILIPDGGPRTKPKACNIGLRFARGEYLVIYDAEDRPEPDQLKKVVATFAASGENLACVQAALNYFNPLENVLTRMFTLEYSYWFDYMLPGLDALGLPIPLGGTSNHFRTEMLRELGGWDPYNVTEDADLGIRASALRSRVRIVSSTTYEEANNAYGNWIRQRSRWIKGYLQTVLVHTRHPLRLVRTVGLRQTLGFALLIGGTPLSFLLGPPLWIILALSLADPSLLQGLIPHWAQVADMATLLGGNAAIIYLNMLAVFKRGRYELIWFALLNPLYWVLHSIASYKALWQLCAGKAYFWEKTVHGLTTDAAEVISGVVNSVATPQGVAGQ
jgi:cellulose synthase/poly-beta-1,6-N-acetylglucosamine synthase-like glycosyltransferase